MSARLDRTLRRLRTMEQEFREAMENEYPCPHCAKWVRGTEALCPHCGHEVDQPLASCYCAKCAETRHEESTFVRKCHVCGCTEEDCHQCIVKTGEPCHWVELDLCSACVTQGVRKLGTERLKAEG